MTVEDIQKRAAERREHKHLLGEECRQHFCLKEAEADLDTALAWINRLVDLLKAGANPSSEFIRRFWENQANALLIEMGRES